MMISGLYLAIAGLMLVYLSLRVIAQRRHKKISVGPAGDPEMERAMRVQGNFTEYTPIGLLLLIVSEVNGLPALAIHMFGITLIAARIIHFLGFRSADAPGIFRVAGMLVTFGTLILLSGIVVVQFLLKAL